MHEAPSRTATPALGLVLIASVLAIHFPMLGYPPVADDWMFIADLARDGGLERLRRSLLPTSAYFYRPLRELVFFLWWSLTGGNSFYFALLMLAVHAATALSVVWIARSLRMTALEAWCAGFLYVAAAPLHSHALSWHVGINDLGGALLANTAIALGLAGRMGASLGAYVAALLFKEAAIAVPFVVYAARLTTLAPKPLRGARGFVIVSALYGVVKAIQLSGDWDYDTRHWYAVSMDPRVSIRNALTYLRLGVSAPWPDVLPEGRLGQAIALVIAVFVALLALRALAGQTRDEARFGRKRVLFLLLWATLSMIPVLPLPKLSSPWFLTQALTPAAMLLACALSRLVPHAFGGRLAGTALPIGITAAIVACGATFVQRVAHADIPDTHAPGPPPQPIVLSRITQQLQAQLPSLLPRGTEPDLIFLHGISLSATLGAKAFRVWYDNPRIEVASFDKLVPCSTGCCLALDGRPVDRARAVALQLSEQTLRVRRLERVVDERCRYTADDWHRHRLGTVLDYRGASGALFSDFYPAEWGLRWTRGTQSTLLFRLDPGARTENAHRLEMLLGALPQQRLRLSLNGVALGATSFPTQETRTMRFDVPPGTLRAGELNRLVFETPDARSPSREDPRMIAVEFFSARFIQVE